MTGKRETTSLSGVREADPIGGKISNESPVGQALLDKEVGDVVEVSTPAGVQKLTTRQDRLTDPPAVSDTISTRPKRVQTQYANRLRRARADKT